MTGGSLSAVQVRDCSKKRYPNQGVALKVLKQIQRLNLPHNKQQRAYWCEACGGWHLTSQPLREQVDLSDDGRRELSIYETPDVARAAVLVAIEVPDVGGTMRLSDLVERWRRRYPRHDAPTAKRTVRTRVLRAVRALDFVGIVLLDEAVVRVTVLDIDGLHMVASNLEIFEDHNGVARHPSRWPRRVEVPAHLRDVQSSLIAAGVVGWKRVANGLGPAGPATQVAGRLTTMDSPVTDRRRTGNWRRVRWQPAYSCCPVAGRDCRPPCSPLINVQPEMSQLGGDAAGLHRPVGRGVR